MSGSGPSFVRTYVAFVGVALATASLVACLGGAVVGFSWPQGRWPSVLAGCGVSWVASCAGAIPVAMAVSARSAQTFNAILGSTAARFLVVLVLVVPLTYCGWFDRVTLVGSTAGSYLLMLLLDTVLAVRVIKRIGESDS